MKGHNRWFWRSVQTFCTAQYPLSGSLSRWLKGNTDQESPGPGWMCQAQPWVQGLRRPEGLWSIQELLMCWLSQNCPACHDPMQTFSFTTPCSQTIHTPSVWKCVLNRSPFGFLWCSLFFYWESQKINSTWFTFSLCPWFYGVWKFWNARILF